MKVQVCNLESPEFQVDFIKSISETGFAVLTGHGVPEEFIRAAQSDWKDFFRASEEYKNRYFNTKNPNMGYRGMKSETAVGAQKADLKEFFHWAPSQHIPFPVRLHTMILFEKLELLSSRILTLLDSVDGSRHADTCRASSGTLLRALYYPAMRFSAKEGAVRAAAHEDISLITLLVAASAPGLQVKDLSGNWHAVPHEENSIVLNVGDMLQLASGGKYRSTTHRVVNPGSDSEDRISIPLFVHPAPKTEVVPGITAEAFLKQRLDEIYGLKK